MNAFERFAERLIFGNRPVVLFLFAAITVAMVFFASQLKVDAGFKKQIPLQHEYMKTFLDYEADFGGANRVLVAVMAKDGNMFSDDYMKTLQAVTKDVVNLDDTDDSRARSLGESSSRPRCLAAGTGSFAAAPWTGRIRLRRRAAAVQWRGSAAGSARSAGACNRVRRARPCRRPSPRE